MRALLSQAFRRTEIAIREDRFDRFLSLIAGFSGLLSGLEVAYEHYKGGYSNRVMYTPVMLSATLAGAGTIGFFSSRAAGKTLRIVSIVTLADCVIGFCFHIRGVGRKPGGWTLPITNIVMGPPIFAPLLFGTSAYLGLVASFPRELRRGGFKKQLAAATAISAFFSGFEAWYSHYKNNFRFSAQWTPVLLAPALIVASASAIGSPHIARKSLPFVSALALADGAVGFFYHARGVLRRPGGMRTPFYNLIYGPPIFAPLLFAACGFLGVLAGLMRRES